MPRKMHFDAFGQEAFATALTASGEGRTTAFGAHAGTETMLLFPGSLGAL